MKATVVFDLAEGPVWADFIDPQPAPGQTLINVRAAAISHVVKARASGRHYSFDGNLPFVPGIDGVGSHTSGPARLPSPSPPPLRQYGAAGAGRPAELSAAAGCALMMLAPRQMANPGMSAWASLVTRAQIQAGETVLINGATGSAGQLAVYRLPAIWGRKKSLQPGAMRSRSRRWTPMSVFS